VESLDPLHNDALEAQPHEQRRRLLRCLGQLLQNRANATRAARSQACRRGRAEVRPPRAVTPLPLLGKSVPLQNRQHPQDRGLDSWLARPRSVTPIGQPPLPGRQRWEVEGNAPAIASDCFPLSVISRIGVGLLLVHCVEYCFALYLKASPFCLSRKKRGSIRLKHISFLNND